MLDIVMVKVVVGEALTIAVGGAKARVQEVMDVQGRKTMIIFCLGRLVNVI